MKKTGSLTKRAILFTAIIAATMVVVALLVYLLAFGRGQDGMPFVWWGWARRPSPFTRFCGR